MPALRDDIDPDGLLEYSVVFSDRSLNSMSDAFGEVMRDISRIMRNAYGAASVAVVPGGGTYGMEAIARQFANDARVLVIRNGWFSYRWSQIMEAGKLASHTTVLAASQCDDNTDAPFAPCPLEDILERIRAEKPGVVFGRGVADERQRTLDVVTAQLGHGVGLNQGIHALSVHRWGSLMRR